MGRDRIDLRLGVHPAAPARDEAAVHAADRLDHVPPLILVVQRMTGALEELHVPVAADHHVELAQRGGFPEELDVAGVEPVEAPRDHDPPPVSRHGGCPADR